jgi:hypothetical protein
MRVHTRTRWLVAALGILALAPGMLWAATPPQTPPTGPGVYYYGGAKNMTASSERYEDGPISHPGIPVLGGPQAVDIPHSFDGSSAFGTNGRLSGSGISATGAAAASKTDTVEKNLRRLAGHLS